MHVGATRFLVLAVLAGLGGCSELEVREGFVAREAGAAQAGNAGAGARVVLEFDDRPRFYSAGVFGMPVIPTYASGSPPRELNLEVRMVLDRRMEYSFAASPCLETSAGALCPELISIAPQFNSGDAYLLDALGRQTGGWVPALSGRSVEYSPAKLGAGGRVTSTDVEKDCFYDGNPPWTAGYVNTIYTYRCAGSCPTEFTLNSDGIAVAGDSFRSSGTYHFTRKRTTKYRGSVPVQ